MTMTVKTDDRAVEASESPASPRRGRSRGVKVGVSGLALAMALVGAGALLRTNADFAAQNVKKQLAEQRITFKAADALNAQEQGTPCLVAYAGLPLTTGQQAECYANKFIGVHLKSVAGGKTFSEMREVQNGLRAQIAEAQASNDPAVADLQRQLGEVTGKRQALFEGETMRGLLLTSYGFGTLGAKADQAADVANVAGAAVLLLSLAVLAGTSIRRARA